MPSTRAHPGEIAFIVRLSGFTVHNTALRNYLRSYKFEMDASQFSQVCLVKDSVAKAFVLFRPLEKRDRMKSTNAFDHKSFEFSETSVLLRSYFVLSGNWYLYSARRLSDVGGIFVFHLVYGSGLRVSTCSMNRDPSSHIIQSTSQSQLTLESCRTNSIVKYICKIRVRAACCTV